GVENEADPPVVVIESEADVDPRNPLALAGAVVGGRVEGPHAARHEAVDVGEVLPQVQSLHVPLPHGKIEADRDVGPHYSRPRPAGGANALHAETFWPAASVARSSGGRAWRKRRKSRPS